MSTPSSRHGHRNLKQKAPPIHVVSLVVFLTRRLMVGFVLKFVKSASLDRLQGLLLIASIRNDLLARLSFFIIIIPIFVIFLFLFLVCLLGRACTIFRARNRDALGLESLFDSRKLFKERGELLDVERDSLQPALVFALQAARDLQNEDPPSFLDASLHPSRRTRGYQLAACP